MKLILHLCCILIFGFSPQTQTITKGLIMPKDDGSFGSCCIYIPTSGISVYHKPNGNVLGKIVQDTERDSNGEFHRIFLELDGQLELIKYPNLHMVGYEVMALVYVQHNSTFVKLNNGYWIKVSELEEKGLEIVDWMQYLIDKSDDVLGYYANNPGLNLRKSPTIQSDIIVTLKGDLWEIKLTEEVKALWCKVIVSEYSEHPCTSKGNFDAIKLRTFTGWIKLLSDDLTPNVSYYAKGC